MINDHNYTYLRRPVLALALCTLSASLALGADAAPAALSYQHAIVVVANPLAAQAGLAALKAGGNAADAAVAVQAVLGLVEPQSSGLGGGAFITYYDAATRQVHAYNGREKAPAGASPGMFLDANGRPLPFPTAVLSGRSTGVPGAIAALALLQREHGQRAWRSLFAVAEQLATDGFVVSPRLAGMISGRAPQASAPDARRYFTKPDGTLYAAGDVLKNAAYAATLRRLAASGPRVLYHGRIARDIVHRVHEGTLPGTLSLKDLASYHPIETAALCRPWQDYQVCTPPPPSGGVGVLEALLLLSRTDIASRGPTDPVAWIELGEAERLMYADRDHYVGDPAFVHVPLDGLLDPGYIGMRAALISAHMPAALPPPGDPPGARAFGPDRTVEPGGTSHFVIVDAAGNVVSITTTVESIFGDGRMVDGFFLNNQLTDFSFSPLERGQPAANAVAAGKQPRSAMSPTIVLDRNGHLIAATGSSGGPAIIAYVVKTLIGALDWHLSMQAAIDLPSLVPHGSAFSAETDKFTPALLGGLDAGGMTLHADRQFEVSGLQGVLVRADGTLEGGVDRHREGVALGF